MKRRIRQDKETLKIQIRRKRRRTRRRREDGGVGDNIRKISHTGMVKGEKAAVVGRRVGRSRIYRSTLLSY